MSAIPTKAIANLSAAVAARPNHHDRTGGTAHAIRPFSCLGLFEEDTFMSAPRDPRAVAQPTKPDESTQHEPRAPGDQTDENSTGLDLSLIHI